MKQEDECHEFIVSLHSLVIVAPAAKPISIINLFRGEREEEES